MIRPKTPLEQSHTRLIEVLQRIANPDDLGSSVTEEVRSIASIVVAHAMEVSAHHEAQQA